MIHFSVCLFVSPQLDQDNFLFFHSSGQYMTEINFSAKIQSPCTKGAVQANQQVESAPNIAGSQVM